MKAVVSQVNVDQAIYMVSQVSRNAQLGKGSFPTKFTFFQRGQIDMYGFRGARLTCMGPDLAEYSPSTSHPSKERGRLAELH